MDPKKEVTYYIHKTGQLIPKMVKKLLLLAYEILG